MLMMLMQEHATEENISLVSLVAEALAGWLAGWLAACLAGWLHEGLPLGALRSVGRAEFPATGHFHNNSFL